MLDGAGTVLRWRVSVLSDKIYVKIHDKTNTVMGSAYSHRVSTTQYKH